MTASIALIGGRGYTGAEFLHLLDGHHGMELAFASSTSQVGMKLSEGCAAWRGSETFCELSPETVGTRHADAWVLAVPNGKAGSWAQAIHAHQPDAIILDLSADHRFDGNWVYGLPERFRNNIRAAKLISNPGCYATGIQLGLLPVLEYLVGEPVVFGVSGYSGAGRTPSEKNSPDRLRDNLLPYSLTGHVHEKEASHQLGRHVRFMPHVASFFRGISLTISARVDHVATGEKLFNVYFRAYCDEPRLKVMSEIPEVQAVRNTPDVYIGGFSVDEREPSMISLVVTLDNLSKGAASQAMQNLNLALGMDEQAGIKYE
ncbi:MAG: N-acetyl-gamma-glutamyl-phosphate reductase [Lysobacterales bacterium]|jgi:N-acetyl-gamma-glutamyl-phosphate reductase